MSSVKPITNSPFPLDYHPVRLSDKDFQLLTKILPGPPQLPLPKTPIFDPNELFKLTFEDQFIIRYPKEIEVQTDIVELPTLIELQQKVNLLVNEFQTFQDDLRRLQVASEYQIKSSMQKAVQLIYLQLRAKTDMLGTRYEQSVHNVRAACRIQLANCIAVLRGLIEASKRRDASEVENQLRQKVLDQETDLQKTKLELQLAKLRIEELETDNQNHVVWDDKPDFELVRPDSIVSHSKTKTPIVQHTDASVQCVLISESRQKQLEQEVAGLNKQNEALKSALLAVQNQVKTLAGQRVSLEDQIGEMKEQMQHLAQDNDVLNKQLNSKDSELNKIKMQMKQLNSEKADALDSLKSLKAERSKWDDLRKKLEGEGNLVKRIEELENSNVELKKQSQQLREELNKAKTRIQIPEPNTARTSGAVIREEALAAEIQRLRHDMDQIKLGAETRIQMFKHRLKVVSQESLVRSELESQNKQLHTVALTYANQNPVVMTTCSHRINGDLSGTGRSDIGLLPMLELPHKP